MTFVVGLDEYNLEDLRNSLDDVLKEVSRRDQVTIKCNSNKDDDFIIMTNEHFYFWMEKVRALAEQTLLDASSIGTLHSLNIENLEIISTLRKIKKEYQQKSIKQLKEIYLLQKKLSEMQKREN